MCKHKQLFICKKDKEIKKKRIYLTELFDFGSLYPDDWASQALVDQQTQLTVKIHAIVLLVLFMIFKGENNIKIQTF